MSRNGIILAVLFSAMVPCGRAQFVQQGAKLAGTGAVGVNNVNQGFSVALSADGNTAIAGGEGDNAGLGAAWVFTRTSGVWTQQSKLVGAGSVGTPVAEGNGVALSADGSTAIVVGGGDNGGVGAAWIFTRANGVWGQQGSKLVGSGATGMAQQGHAVSLSADGNTAIVGGFEDNTGAGAAWIFTRSNGVWSQQGSKLVGSGATGAASQGLSVALSGDGNTAIIGGQSDNNGLGAAWIFTLSNGVWSQQGSKLTGGGAVGFFIYQGVSVSLSADGNTAILGGDGDSANAGAAWVFTRSGGVWSQQGAKLTGSGAAGLARQGRAVSLSADGNTAVVGGSDDNSMAGAAWVFIRSNGVWSQPAGKLTGSGAVGAASQGYSAAISADASTAIVGGPNDNSVNGAAWVFTQPVATHFTVSAPASAAAGTPINFTVTALDAGNNPVAGYTGTVHFTSSDSAAVLPANTQLTNGTGTFPATLNTTASQTITATDTVAASIAGISSGIAVGLPVTHFLVAAPGSVIAGVPFAFTVTALDANNHASTAYTGTVHFTSSDSLATLPADTALTNGTGTFTVTLPTASTANGLRGFPIPSTLTATDQANSSITGTSSGINVAVLSGVHILVSAPAMANAGTASSLTVTVVDMANSQVTGYNGTVHFTSSDATAVLPANTTLTNGTGNVSATLKTAGSQTITATDTVISSITGTSNATVVDPAAATHLNVAAPSLATSGSAFNFTVTAQDAFSNTVPLYTGTVHFSSGDPTANLPADATLTRGTGTFPATLTTVGSQTITATDTATASITGATSVSVVVLPATHFTVTAPASATAGVALTVTVTALDTNNATVLSYSGIVHFTSTDSAAALPADTTLTHGTGSVQATLKTAGNQTVTATDTASASITGISGAIGVSAAAATHLKVAAAATATAGAALTFTVTALDAFNNTAPSYAGSVRFSSSDSAAILPANSPLTNGAGGFQTTFQTGGNQTVTATDTATASITGTSGAIAVGGGPATHFKVVAPATATAGSALNFTVTALDQFNNTATGYTGTAHFSSSDTAATLPADTALTNGAGTFAATLKAAGNQTIAATDTVTATIAGTSGSIAVSATAATHLKVTAPVAAAPGTTFNFSVTAQDQFNNTATTYAGAVHFTSSDSTATLPADAALTNGTGTFPATLRAAGSQTITATDTVGASITGTSTIAVGALLATHFSVTAQATATAGVAFNFTVTALDANNAAVTGYTGAPHFASSDLAATLPANTALTNGTGTFPATLKTAGNQTITATDTATSSIAGTSTAIAVGAAAATRLRVAAPSPEVHGVAFNVTVTAQDPFSNTVPGYTGTVHFGSSDGAAILPPNATLTNGTGIFSATLSTAGSQTITATDTVTASITGVSASIVVTGGLPTHFAVAAPASATPGAPFNFTVTALDAANGATAYSGTAHFSSSDAMATLPADTTLTGGTGTFSATLNTAGNQTITAMDTVTASIAGASGAIAVGGGTAAIGVSPGAGSGSSQIMIFTFTDPRGYQDLDVVDVLMNNFLDGRQACYLAYSRTAGVLYPVDDSGLALEQGLALNGSGSAGNSQCTVTGAGSSAVGNGNSLILTLNLSFSAGFAGNKVMYLAARDLEGGNSGWQALGSWGVPGATTFPSVGGVNPARGAGSSQTFTFTFSDTKGYQDLGVVDILINNFLDGRQACYLAYSRPVGVLYLVNDAGTALSPGMALNASGGVAPGPSNSQCTVNATGSSAAGSGNTLTLTLNVSFSAAFAGNRVIYAAARDSTDANNSGWQAAGSWTAQ